MEKKLNSKRAPLRPRKIATVTQPLGGSFYVVGIGASAGGLDALERFFRSMPNDTGMAFIVVTHLDPTHVSIMPELLQKATGMKLFQAEDGMKVKPNHVYVAPANRDLAMLHGAIQLIEPLEAHGFRLPIDFFFKSLSEDLGDKAICIVLTGMASDGSVGLRAIKSELGMVMVQDPKSAKFDGMPVSAIKTGCADYILPPEEMPNQLIRYASLEVKGSLEHKDNVEGTIPDTLQKVFILLKTHTGHDFSLYKQNTISRRVERRMNVTQLDTLPNYFRLLQETPGEIDNLFRELLIGVTSFFRDPECFTELKKILLELAKSKPENGRIRIWVPGCSTGEEAYSIAIILRECMDELKKSLTVQIFATDIDSSAIDKARVGTYTGIANEVTKERLNRFFTIDGDLFRVRKNIREMMIFAPQSVIKDSPFIKLDLISCRNLLIYLSAELQKTIVPLFHYSLMTGGMLVLGPSETISGFVDLFSLANAKWKFYNRRDSILSAQSFIDFPMSRSPVRAQEVAVRKNELKNISQLAEKAILQNYSPNCVIVNEKGDIVYIHGRTGKYLELTHGEARMNIFDMAREGLQHELSVMIRKVLSSKKPLTVNGLKVRSGGIAQHINLTVKPIKEPSAMRGSLLVIFEDVPRPKKGPVARIPHFEKNSARVIKDLEHELKSNKEYLQSAIEELEASNEELKSSNEELQSTNEEIQSANEELQTSKEELQSLNEELITVNTELLSKNDELSVVSNDMKNLFDSTCIPTIFLDNELGVKRFTANTTKVVNLIPSDVGRPINHIATNLQYDSLISDIATVLRTLVYKETEVQTKDGVWYLMRILPYRTTDNFIDGVVITFLDIHKAKGAFEVIHKLNDDLELAREYADNIVDTVREALLVIDKDLVVISANRPYYKIFNTVKERTVGKHIYEIDDKKWAIPELRQMLEEILPKKNFFEDFEVNYDLTHGSRKRFLLNARQIYQAESGRKLILLAIHERGINE